MNLILEMLISNLDKVILMLHNAVEQGSSTDKNIETLAFLILRYQDRLRAAVATTATVIDDKVIEELVEAAQVIWTKDYEL